MMKKSVALHNLGCKVNAYELDVMTQKLEERGFAIVPFEEKADIYIVNTCSVTNIADRKSRQMLHQARKRNPDALVVAAGCYVQTGRAGAISDEAVDLVIGNNRKKFVAEILLEYLEREEPEEETRREGEARETPPGGNGGPGGLNADRIDAERKAELAGADLELGTDELAGRKSPDKTLGGKSVVDIGKETVYEEMQLSRTAGHTRAYIKIQDGCNQFCSYCIIPYVRGRVRSRREEDILREVRGLVANGFREVVLTGIHISSYGLDFAGKKNPPAGEAFPHGSLLHLLGELNGIEGLARIRLGSLEPRIITPEFVAGLREIGKLCHHFHLSLQSGCDETLARMNRHYTAGEYLKKVEMLREAFGRPAITTDVIVGFPGETDEEFAKTRRFLETVNFYEMHIFQYSRREGTVAANRKDQVPEETKKERSEVLLALAGRQSKHFLESYIGERAEVLFEETREVDGASCQVGYTGEYIRVAKKTDEILSGKICSGKLIGLKDNLLWFE